MKLAARLTSCLLVLLCAAALPAAEDADLSTVEGYPGLVRKPVEIWSDGTRLAGDVFRPSDLETEEKLPAIVLCHGWGGTKSHLNQAIAPRFAAAGYVVLAFDYRGWGESDPRLVLHGELPEPDEEGRATVEVQAIREVVDPFDQQEDIDAAISFIRGEPHVDPSRIGIWGSSFGGGHVIWRAAHDDRVQAVVSQVGGYSRTELVPEARERAMQTAKTRRARGELEPAPQGGPVNPELRGTPYMERIAAFRPGDHIDEVEVPVLIVQAEKEHYFDVALHGDWAHETLQARGVPVEYHVLPDIGHYDIYRGEALDEAMRLEIAFFDQHLKGAGR